MHKCQVILACALEAFIVGTYSGIMFPKMATGYSAALMHIRKRNVMYNNKVYKTYSIDHTACNMNQAQAAPRLEQVNVHSVMEKMQSKKDVFNFLTMECEAYLPKMDTINTYFLKQITSGKKDVSWLSTNALVCQAIRSEGGSSASD